MLEIANMEMKKKTSCKSNVREEEKERNIRIEGERKKTFEYKFSLACLNYIEEFTFQKQLPRIAKSNSTTTNNYR